MMALVSWARTATPVPVIVLVARPQLADPPVAVTASAMAAKKALTVRLIAGYPRLAETVAAPATRISAPARRTAALRRRPRRTAPTAVTRIAMGQSTAPTLIAALRQPVSASRWAIRVQRMATAARTSVVVQQTERHASNPLSHELSRCEARVLVSSVLGTLQTLGLFRLALGDVNIREQRPHVLGFALCRGG